MKGASLDTTPAPRVSFILLNYRSGDYVQSLVDSLAVQSCSDWELIVVDNDSRDGSLGRILARLDFHGLAPARVICLKKNRHFAAGMNAGICEAKGDIVVTLNSDIYLDQNYDSTLLAAAGNQPEQSIGTYCGTQYQWDWAGGSLTDQIQGQGISISRRLGSCCWIYGISPVSKLLGPCGCASAFTKKALEFVKMPNGDYYDSRFMAYSEDLDLFLRIRLAGFRPIVIPELVYWHIGSASYAEGKLSLLTKPGPLIGHVLANKWRIWRKIPSRAEKYISFLLVTLHNLIVLGYVLVARTSIFGATIQSYRASLFRIRNEDKILYPTSPGELGLYSGLRRFM